MAAQPFDPTLKALVETEPASWPIFLRQPAGPTRVAVRVWELPPELILGSGFALLPLAPSSAVTEGELPGIIQRMEQRLRSRREQRQALVIWAAAYLLLGLRYSPALAAHLFRGVVSMKESLTYQAVLQEGRMEGAIVEARKLLRIFGERAFGPPDARTATAIKRIDDLARLEELCDRWSQVESWQELLRQPGSGRQRKPRRESR